MVPLNSSFVPQKHVNIFDLHHMYIYFKYTSIGLNMSFLKSLSNRQPSYNLATNLLGQFLVLVSEGGVKAIRSQQCGGFCDTLGSENTADSVFTGYTLWHRVAAGVCLHSDSAFVFSC